MSLDTPKAISRDNERKKSVIAVHKIHFSSLTALGPGVEWTLDLIAGAKLRLSRYCESWLLPPASISQVKLFDQPGLILFVMTLYVLGGFVATGITRCLQLSALPAVAGSSRIAGITGYSAVYRITYLPDHVGATSSLETQDSTSVAT